VVIGLSPLLANRETCWKQFRALRDLDAVDCKCHRATRGFDDLGRGLHHPVLSVTCNCHQNGGGFKHRQLAVPKPDRPIHAALPNTDTANPLPLRCLNHRINNGLRNACLLQLHQIIDIKVVICRRRFNLVDYELIT